MKLVVATHNEGKLVEMRRILEDLLKDRADEIELVTAGSLGLPDPVEDGVTFEQNALLKATDVARRTGLPAIADDSGLAVDVMHGAPGIFSARWSGKHGDDDANNALLLAQLADINEPNRGAAFMCAAALAVPSPEPLSSSAADLSSPAQAAQDSEYPYAVAWSKVEVGQMRGRLLRETRGEHGLGYDPLFVPDDQSERVSGGEPLTSAQMTAEEKDAISHRGKALRALLPTVAQLLH